MSATSELLLSTEVIELEQRWLLFAKHADPKLATPSCIGPGRPCIEVARICRDGGQSAQLDQLYDACCELGRPLFGDWRMACMELRAAYRKQ